MYNSWAVPLTPVYFHQYNINLADDCGTTFDYIRFIDIKLYQKFSSFKPLIPYYYKFLIGRLTEDNKIRADTFDFPRLLGFH